MSRPGRASEQREKTQPYSREALRELVLCTAQTIVYEENPNGLTVPRLDERFGYTIGTPCLVFDNLYDVAMQVDARTLTAARRDRARARTSGATFDAPLDGSLGLVGRTVSVDRLAGGVLDGHLRSL